MKKRLLVNYIYFSPVGHAIEALRYTLGYYKAKSGFEISLVLSKHTSHFLADLCPWIQKTYVVNLPWDAKTNEVSQSLINHIPRSWDYVVSDERSKTTDYCPEPFFSYYKLADQYFSARIAKGFCGDKAIPYSQGAQLDLKLPKKNLNFAKEKIIKTKVKIGIMFAGHGDPEQNPSIEGWQKVINALYKRHQNLSVYSFGKIKRTNGETVTAGIKESDINNFLRNYPKSANCFDLGLLNQLAVVKDCDVFISPHTGFAFAVLSVGTPWLTISGTHWAEYFYNGVPFYSVLPKCKKYPCYEKMLKQCLKNIKEGKTVLCMTKDRLEKDLPEILEGVETLINKKWDYQTCLKKHFEKLAKLYGTPEKIYSFDNEIHEQFVKK